MSIQLLSPQLANQIAAGEVVERPASVVKELLENSLDAGATKIEIYLEQGGVKQILLRDNGVGIVKDELTLALTRHATSKISSLDDLNAILSLGFRGEALASISSVSRLTLTSRTAEQQEAWEAYSEGREMNVTVKPASHPVGTSVKVLDLFYNTPARKRFLRTEKTEFMQVDEVIRRIALSRFDVDILLYHNGRLVRQYRAGKTEQAKSQRLGVVANHYFAQHALNVEWLHDDLRIHGWVLDPKEVEQYIDIQYFYVNGRIVKDKLLNHAIKQAYQQTNYLDVTPAYILYLDVNPNQVDVNVHPAKHEVRFHQSRLIHDFVLQAVLSILESSSFPLTGDGNLDKSVLSMIPENRVAAGENSFLGRDTSHDLNGVLKTDDNPQSVDVSVHDALPCRERKTGVSYRSSHQGKLSKQESRVYRSFIERGLAVAEGDQLRSSANGLPETEGRPTLPLFPERTSAFDLRPQLLLDSAQAITLDSDDVNDIVASSLNKSQVLTLGRVLMISDAHYALVEHQSKLAVVSLLAAEKYHIAHLYCQQILNRQNEALLVPLSWSFHRHEVAEYQAFIASLNALGFTCEINKQRVVLHSVPMLFRKINLLDLLSRAYHYCLQNDYHIETLKTYLLSQVPLTSSWTTSQAIQLFSELELNENDDKARQFAQLLHYIDLKKVIVKINDSNK